MITDSISDPQLKPHTSWGFPLYRCTYSDEPAWQRMLQLINAAVQRSLDLENRRDLLPRHELIAHNDQLAYDGTTSHEVRDHFRVWAAHAMMDRLVDPHPQDLEVMLRADGPGTTGPEWFLGARYNFCLFVDELCLESLREMRSPVVKLLWKQWGQLQEHERTYSVNPEWHDGSTDEEEEDVGWMYMSVSDYVEWYERLHEPEYWYGAYARPPTMYGELETPGFWRKG
ncbi:hypothetical protein FE257_008431 [Aspergillus nanangensis]|uniref:Uncharacterized protein n=1 Tax=Aspergillus nanangensis TaxID=2582783 RepID=A0AAD4GUQ1_ASPNN|nr:hypothetical protein FE257_008431 [Aspergillus nanangensis]